VPSLPQNTVYRMITKLEILNANISIFQEKIIPKNLFKKGGANEFATPPFRRKGGASVPLHPPPLVTGLSCAEYMLTGGLSESFFKGGGGV